MIKPNHPPSQQKTTRVNELIHLDTVGPIRTTGNNNEKHFVVFVDDFSRWVTVIPTTLRGSAARLAIQYIERVENERSLRVGTLRMDQAPEFLNHQFIRELDLRLHVKPEFVPTYSPHLNARVERANHTIMMSARCMLLESRLPLSFWPDAVRHAAFTYNRTPSSAINFKTPFELYKGYFSSSEHFFAFGEQVKVFLHKEAREDNKFSDRGWIGVHLGGVSHVGYKILDPKSGKWSMETNVATYRGGTEFGLPGPAIGTSTQQMGGSSREQELLEIDEDAQSEEQVSFAEPDEENLDMHSPVRHEIIRQASVQSAFSSSESRTNHFLRQPVEPIDWQEALSSPHKYRWIEAMQQEMEMQERNKTFTISSLQEAQRHNSKVLHSKFVYKLKVNSEGEVQQFKSRWVICGNGQRPGVDFDLSSSSVLSRMGLFFLLGFAVKFQYFVTQFDAVGAYLNAPIDRPTFVRAPAGIVFNPGTILRLHRSVYGLKQSGRQWMQTLSNFLLQNNWRRLIADTNLFIKNKVLLGFYVDDFACAAPNLEISNQVFSELSARFAMRNLGPVNQLLEMEMIQSRGRIEITMKGYLNKLLHNHKSITRRPKTPLPVEKYNKVPDNLKKLNDENHSYYRSLVGEIQYVANAARPDLLFAANFLGRFCAEPTIGDCHTMGYLLSTRNSSLLLEDDANAWGISAFCDADFGSGERTMLSTSGYILFLGSSPLQWRSNLQQRTPTSTAEAEVVAFHKTTEDVEVARLLLFDVEEITRPLLSAEEFEESRKSSPIFCDNKACVDIIKSGNPGRTIKKRSREIASACELFDTGVIEPNQVSGEDQCADILTKATPGPRHAELAKMCGVKLVFSTDTNFKELN